MSVLLNNLLFAYFLEAACEQAVEVQQWAILTASSVACYSYKVIAKAVVVGARRGATKAPKQKVRLNSTEKRQQITLACKAKAAARATKAKEEAAARAAKAKQEAAQMASCGNTLSAITIAARAAQASAQKAVNAVRKLQALITPKKVKVNNEKNTIKGIISVKADNVSVAQRDDWHKLTHVTKSTNNKIVNAKDEFKTFAKVKEEKIKQDKVNRAKAQALKEERIKLRKEKVARICAKAWMEKGIWVDSFLAEACNDSDYAIREQSYRELLALIGGAK